MAARMGRLLAGLAALEDVEGFLRRRPIVDDRPDRADHADRVGGLPDVAAMSTPAAPASRESYASSSASSSVSSLGPPATTRGTGQPSTTLSKSGSQKYVFTKCAPNSAAMRVARPR